MPRSTRATRTERRLWLFLPALAVSTTIAGVESTARAADADADANRAQSEVTSVERESSGVQAAIERARAARYTVEERLANGELLYRTKDYARAAVVFSEILEEFPNTPSYPDALWLRGETFYEQKEYLSARRDYRELVLHGQEPRFNPYLPKALARLIDVCLRIDDIKGLEEVFAKIDQLPPAQVDAALLYAKGKGLYFRGDYAAAGTAMSSIPNGQRYTHQARYFQGLVAMRSAPTRVVSAPAGTTPTPAANTTPSTTAAPAESAPALDYRQAIEAFRVVTQLPIDSEEHRHVVDLAWMAIGRLNYEMENFTTAAEAYSKIGRESPEFATMLYELAWVYVRLGDVHRAERALEVLQIADPDSPVVSEGTLLRADLLLRAGAFDKALQLYLATREQYEPMRAKVEAFLDTTTDPVVYYEKLSQQQLDLLDQNDQLPPLAVRWAREAEDGPMAFAVIDDVNQCKALLRDSYQLIDKLTVILSAANRVRAFPELAAGEQTALSLLNRLSKMRLTIAKGLDDEEPDSLGGEIGQARTERRAAMGTVAALPISSGEFAERDYVGTRQWNTVSQDLTRRTVEVDYLNATVNGLRRMLKDDGVTRSPADIERFQAELDENERILKQRQTEIADLRRLIEIGRAQIGIGDGRYQNDATARASFRSALEREVGLAAQGQGGDDARKYAARIKPALDQAGVVEDRLVAQFAEIEQQVARRITEVQAKVDAEKVKIDQYNYQLGALDVEAHGLVGEVARRNFGVVRDKLRNIVLRADVGITEQAWEVREEELDRVHNLQTERAREEQTLDDELREVLDDEADAKPFSR